MKPGGSLPGSHTFSLSSGLLLLGAEIVGRLRNRCGGGRGGISGGGGRARRLSWAEFRGCARLAPAGEKVGPSSPGAPEACKSESTHPGSSVPHRQPAASKEKDSLGGADQSTSAWQRSAKAPDLKNGGRFLIPKRQRVQTSEEDLRLSTVREVAVLRHLETLEQPYVVSLKPVCSGFSVREHWGGACRPIILPLPLPAS